MTTRRGKKHDYVGMVLDFLKEGAFNVDMEDYLKDMLINLPKDKNGTATTPAADHLIKVWDNAPKLNKERAKFFHHILAQMLFVAQCGQPDL